jgi:hypothetical protein
MPRPKASPASYRDVIPMLEFAKRSGGARFNCGTLANAIRTVQRMNQFRIVDRRINFDIHKNKPPKDPDRLYWHELAVQRMDHLVSEYDGLVIRRPTDMFVVVDVKPDKPWLEAYDANMNFVEDIRSDDQKQAAIEEQRVINEQEPDWSKHERPEDRLQRLIVPDGTTRAPREKFDPSKPLIDDDDISP